MPAVYGVAHGRQRGFFATWDECKEQVHGYRNSMYKKFKTRVQAERWMEGIMGPSFHELGKPCTEKSSECVLYLSDSDSDLPQMGKQPCVDSDPALHLKPESPEIQLIPIDKEPEPELSKEQQAIMQDALDGHSMLITGSAGTGKSFTLQQVIQRLTKKHQGGVHVAASTGIAADAIGGTTLHSLLCMGIPRYVEDFKHAKRKKSVWNKAKVLVIDEVSMISGELWDQVSHLLQRFMKSSHPYGGLQIILCGDFFQLSPIFDKNVPDAEASKRFIQSSYLFESKSWNSIPFRIHQLTHIFRQEDVEFAAMLDRIRWGRIDEPLQRRLASLCRPLQPQHGIEPTQLFTTNARVDTLNAERLACLEVKSYTYTAEDHVKPVDRVKASMLYRDGFFTRCSLPASVELKVGAQVMLLFNCDLASSNRLVNGSRGVVDHFIPRDSIEVERAMQSKISVPFGPTRTMDAGGRNSTRRFEQKFLHQTTMLPVVKFMNGRTEIILPMSSAAHLHSRGSVARTQIPLRLAWAVTVHKSQGMSLDYVNVHLGGCFAEGQAYVALSRARSLDGLSIEGYSSSAIFASSQVARFYRGCTRMADEGVHSSRR